MKNSAKFLLGTATIILIYFLWLKDSRSANQTSKQVAIAAVQTTPRPARHSSTSADIPSPMVQPALTQMPLDPLSRRLAVLHSKLRQWRESQIRDPDDEEGRRQLMTELLAMVTDENVVEVIQSLSPDELNTPFGMGALRHWMRLDPTIATDWLAARPDSTKEQILAVAEDWTSNPDGLQQYMDQLPQSRWKQNFLEQASSAALSDDPSEAIKLAWEMDSGDAQTNLLRSAACKWISTDPNAALDWITSISDPSLREQLTASAAQSYALTDPSLSMSWLTSQVQSTPLIKDAACNILETWVSTDPVSAAAWVSGISDGDLKTEASKIVFNHWSQTDPNAASAWAESLQVN